MADTQATGSTVPRRQLGRYLRTAREGVRMTIKAAAEAVELSDATIWRIESGRVPVRTPDVHALCRIYGVAPDLTDALTALAKETKGRGWWHAYGDVIPNWLDLYVGLESAAESLKSYESEMVPGLLQTPDYARAIIENQRPDLEPAEIARKVDLKMARQALLTRPVAPPGFQVVLSETVVRRTFGSGAVMAAQWRRLAEVSELPHVELRIVPFRAGFHPGMLSGAFVILEFPSSGGGKMTEPPTVYVEGFTGALYLDRPDEIERYEQAFAHLWSMPRDDSGGRARDFLWRMEREING